MNVELLEFARRALEKGISREQITDVLKRAGWPERDIAAALGAALPIDFPIPVPRPRPYLSPREAMTYALFFTGLYLSVFNLGWLVFHVLSRAAQSGNGVQPAASMIYYLAGQRAMIHDALRANVAALVVAFPLFLFLFRTMKASAARESSMRGASPRRWFVALALFLAVTTLVGDLSALVYNALAGDLPTAFVVRVLAVGAVAGGAFGYFLTEMRRANDA